MEAYDLFCRILKTPRKLELATESNTPEELQKLLNIKCNDLAEDVFWIAKHFIAFDSI